MKRIFILFFVLMYFSSFSQNYTFNLLTRYSVNYDDFKKENIVYSNSKDSSYFLTVTHNGNGTLATLYDIRTKTMAKYKVLETKSKNGEIEFSFHFETKVPYNYANTFYEKEFEFTPIPTDSLYKTVVMKSFKSRKKRKIDGTIELKIRKHSDNLFPLYRFSCLHPFELREDLNFQLNGIIESATGKLNGKKINHKLVVCKDVDFVLKTQ